MSERDAVPKGGTGALARHPRLCVFPLPASLLLSRHGLRTSCAPRLHYIFLGSHHLVIMQHPHSRGRLCHAWFLTHEMSRLPRSCSGAGPSPRSASASLGFGGFGMVCREARRIHESHYPGSHKMASRHGQRFPNPLLPLYLCVSKVSRSRAMTAMSAITAIPWLVRFRTVRFAGAHLSNAALGISFCNALILQQLSRFAASAPNLLIIYI